MKKSTILFLSMTILVSCENKVDDKFILSNPPKKTDSKELIFSDYELNAIMHFNQDKNFTDSLDIKPVIIKDEIKKLFDPETCPCSLPNKVKKKLNKLKDDGKSWAPSYIVSFLNEFPENGFQLSGKSVSSLMHSIIIKSIDGTTKNWILLGSPTFENFDIDKFVARKGFNSFIYSLDCSGYLNAAIEASGTVPGGDIKTSAQSALENQNSMFVGGGVIISPINAAFYGDALGVTLDTLERLEILNSIIKIPKILETDSIIISNSYEVIWASKDGNSSFNGKANFEASGRAGIGIASITAKGGAGGELSRKSSFTSFNTYYTSRKRISDISPFTLKEVKDLVDDLKEK